MAQKKKQQAEQAAPVELWVVSWVGTKGMQTRVYDRLESAQHFKGYLERHGAAYVRLWQL